MIHYQLGSCSLGCVIVAVSQKGVCAIAMDDDPDSLALWLKQTYPHAKAAPENTQLTVYLQQVLNYAEQPDSGLDLPLDMQGTAFQQQVWEALSLVPAGSTRSYSQLAQMVGRPAAVRAVASACAANRLALAVPCHRVVAKNGQLAGYRWGTQRKQILLEKEARALSA